MSKIKIYWKQMTARWRAKMPQVFKKVMYIGTGISGLAIAVHTALVMSGALEPQWWVTSYPYIIGIPAGAAFMAKFTREQPKDIQNDDK